MNKLVLTALVLFASHSIIFSMFQEQLNSDLLDAASRGEAERIKSILQAGANINAQDIYAGHTPLHFAIYGQIKVLKLLLDNGANPNIENTCGKTPLVLAMEKDVLEMVQVLLEKGAVVAQKNQFNLDAIDCMIRLDWWHPDHPIKMLLEDYECLRQKLR